MGAVGGRTGAVGGRTGAVGGRTGPYGGRMGAVRGRMGAIGAIPRPSGPYGGRPGPMAPGDVFTGQGCMNKIVDETIERLRVFFATENYNRKTTGTLLS